MITDSLRSTKLGIVSPATMSSTSELLEASTFWLCVPSLHMLYTWLNTAATAAVVHVNICQVLLPPTLLSIHLCIAVAAVQI